MPLPARLQSFFFDRSERFLQRKDQRRRDRVVVLPFEPVPAKQLEVEWGQLQLEQSTWAMHSRIERIAARNIGMRVPNASRVQVVAPAGAEGER